MQAGLPTRCCLLSLHRIGLMKDMDPFKFCRGGHLNRCYIEADQNGARCKQGCLQGAASWTGLIQAHNRPYERQGMPRRASEPVLYQSGSQFLKMQAGLPTRCCFLDMPHPGSSAWATHKHTTDALHDKNNCIIAVLFQT